MCEIEKINIECYFSDYEKLKSKVQGHEDKIDWKKFCNDNSELFCKQFIIDYNKYIKLEYFNLNIPSIQGNLKLVNTLIELFSEDYLSTVTHLYYVKFYNEYKDKLSLKNITYISLGSCDFVEIIEKDCYLFDSKTIVDYINQKYTYGNIDIFKKLSSSFIKENLNSFNIGNIGTLSEMKILDYSILKRNDSWNKHNISNISETLFINIKHLLTDEEIKYYQRTNARYNSFVRFVLENPEHFDLNLCEISIYQRIIIFFKGKIKFKRIFNGILN